MKKTMKRAAVLLCGLALVAALPVAAAFADDSPTGTKTHTDQTVTVGGLTVNIGVDAVVTANDAANWQVKAKQADPVTPSSGVPAGAENIGSFEVYPELLSGAGMTEDEMWVRAGSYSYSLTFNLNTDAHNGKIAYVTLQHRDGTMELITAQITDGKIVLASGLDLMNVSVAVSDEPGTGGGSSSGTNTGSISPKTGYADTSLMVCVLGVAAVACAGALAFSLRSGRSRR